MKTIFVKRNDVYCEQFRLKTEILLDKDRKYVVKKPLSPAAKEHILNMYYGIDKLNLYYTNLEVCKGMLKENELWFDFIEGEPLTKKFIEARQKGKASDFFYWLDYYIKLIQGNHKNQCRFYYTEDFIDYFGNVLGLEETPALKFTPFDITSNNIIIRENNVPVLIDYEWCLDFPMPKDFVIYRCIINLYKLHPDFEQFVTFDKVVDYLNFDINKDLLKKLWDYFYKRIITSPESGKSHFDIFSNYVKKQINITEADGKIRDELLEARKYINEFEKLTKAGFAEKDNYITELERQIKTGFEEQDKYIKELENQMKTGFAEKDQYITALENQMTTGFAEKDQYITALETQMKTGFAEKDQYITALETQMKTGFAEKDQYITALENQMKAGFAEKDNYIAELENQIKIGFTEKENYIAKIENDIHYLNGTIKKNKDCIQQLEEEVNNKNQIISNLRKELYDIQSSSAWKLIKPFYKGKK